MAKTSSTSVATVHALNNMLVIMVC